MRAQLGGPFSIPGIRYVTVAHTQTDTHRHIHTLVQVHTHKGTDRDAEMAVVSLRVWSTIAAQSENEKRVKKKGRSFKRSTHLSPLMTRLHCCKMLWQRAGEGPPNPSCPVPSR